MLLSYGRQRLHLIPPGTTDGFLCPCGTRVLLDNMNRSSPLSLSPHLFFCLRRMHLQVYLVDGKRVYTLKKVDPEGKPTLSAHPARFSPDDKFSRHRITIKRRFKCDGGSWLPHQLYFKGLHTPSTMNGTSTSVSHGGDWNHKTMNTTNSSTVQLSFPVAVSTRQSGAALPLCLSVASETRTSCLLSHTCGKHAPIPVASLRVDGLSFTFNFRQIATGRLTSPLSRMQRFPFANCGLLRRGSAYLRWKGLAEVQVHEKRTDTNQPTLDGTLDLVGYQLFRDGLLPSSSTAVAKDGEDGGAGRLLFPNKGISPHELAQKDAAVTALQKNGMLLRRSIKETALTIGCDEAGRGPLAGPVVGAAVCRIPVSSFNNDSDQLYNAPEQFQIFDSKSVSERQRNVVFSLITGHLDFFDVAAVRHFKVHHCGKDGCPDHILATRRFVSHQKLSRLPLKKLLSMQTPFLISYHGANCAGNYLYLWSIGIANHSYIDRRNIYASSMHTMHRTAQSVWYMLNDTRFALEMAPRPRGCSIAQYLFSRYCIAAAKDKDKRYRVPHHIELIKGLSNFGDPVQPPLVIFDGHAVPLASYRYFVMSPFGGDTQPLIEGDKRSVSIAAASCLAKVARDEMMTYLGGIYPGYNFDENKGYPVESHMRCVALNGLSPVHRKTFRPCKDAIEARSIDTGSVGWQANWCRLDKIEPKRVHNRFCLQQQGTIHGCALSTVVPMRCAIEPPPSGARGILPWTALVALIQCYNFSISISIVLPFCISTSFFQVVW
eukprot:gene5002-3597_t